MTAPADDDFLFRQGATMGLGKTRFHDYRKVYGLFDLPNVTIFKKQIRLYLGDIYLLSEGSVRDEQLKMVKFLATCLVC